MLIASEAVVGLYRKQISSRPQEPGHVGDRNESCHPILIIEDELAINVDLDIIVDGIAVVVRNAGAEMCERRLLVQHKDLAEVRRGITGAIRSV